MNPADLYRQSMVVAPTHTLLARLHEQAGLFTQNAARFADEGDLDSARKNIQYAQDIISFLRSSLDLNLEASVKSDAVYAFYYGILVDWFISLPQRPQEYQDMLTFWGSWADTWRKISE